MGALNYTGDIGYNKRFMVAVWNNANVWNQGGEWVIGYFGLCGSYC